MNNKLYQVDAFSREPFKGNPAAVCLLAQAEPDEWLQSLAAEMNLSETAFLLENKTGWNLRWFTPATEVDLCGHATLASAKVLFETRPELRESPIRFQTRSGELTARWQDGKVELDFPVMRYLPIPINPGVADVLGFQPVKAVFSGGYYLFEAEDPQLIRDAKPNMAELAKLPMPEVIITAKSGEPSYDFISRFFAPQLGIPEDPVTGSAHCLLTPYWAERLGKLEFTAFQASVRGGELVLQLVEDRVIIIGEAKLIFTATLWV
jgi:predicted PhzF superfamily epimerase YddE/YHI9